tara:strand:- start:1747 stop:2019 length:273 start_codon:yes stop_codon:yes gene_type:complete
LSTNEYDFNVDVNYITNKAVYKFDVVFKNINILAAEAVSTVKELFYYNYSIIEEQYPIGKYRTHPIRYFGEGHVWHFIIERYIDQVFYEH